MWHSMYIGDWSSDVCSSELPVLVTLVEALQSMFVLPGQKVKVGGVVSVTVMVWTQLVLELPQRSEERRVGEVGRLRARLHGVTVSMWVIVEGGRQSRLDGAA